MRARAGCWRWASGVSAHAGALDLVGAGRAGADGRGDELRDLAERHAAGASQRFDSGPDLQVGRRDRERGVAHLDAVAVEPQLQPIVADVADGHRPTHLVHMVSSCAPWSVHPRHADGPLDGQP